MKKTLAPSVTHSDPKGRKFMTIVGNAYDKAGLNNDEGQQVNEATGLADLIAGFINEHRTREEFRKEEVKSNYGYLSGYVKPTDLNAQCNQLRMLFPGGLGFPNQDLLTRIEKGGVKLPQYAEGWFAVPNWQKNPKIFGSTYSEAVQKVLDTINKALDGKFYNYRNGQIDEQHLRQSANAVEFWKKISLQQEGAEILIIPAQFGIRHRGRSVRRARVIMEDSNGEVGLGSFAGGNMLLTHPNRLQHYDDLWIDLVGDEFNDPVSVRRFSRAPYFNFHDDEVKFDTRLVSRANDNYGSASGFVPQK